MAIIWNSLALYFYNGFCVVLFFSFYSFVVRVHCPLCVYAMGNSLNRKWNTFVSFLICNCLINLMAFAIENFIIVVAGAVKRAKLGIKLIFSRTIWHWPMTGAGSIVASILFIHFPIRLIRMINVFIIFYLQIGIRFVSFVHLILIFRIWISRKIAWSQAINGEREKNNCNSIK